MTQRISISLALSLSPSICLPTCLLLNDITRVYSANPPIEAIVMEIVGGKDH